MDFGGAGAVDVDFTVGRTGVHGQVTVDVEDDGPVDIDDGIAGGGTQGQIAVVIIAGGGGCARCADIGGGGQIQRQALGKICRRKGGGQPSGWQAVELRDIGAAADAREIDVGCTRSGRSDRAVTVFQAAAAVDQRTVRRRCGRGCGKIAFDGGAADGDGGARGIARGQHGGIARGLRGIRAEGGIVAVHRAGATDGQG